MFTKLKREHTCSCGEKTDYDFRVTSSREDFEDIQARQHQSVLVSRNKIMWCRQCSRCGAKDLVELVILLE